jgi:hypothetical protein
LAATIAATPELDWLLLTKRIENFDRLAPWPRHQVPENVWRQRGCYGDPLPLRGSRMMRRTESPVWFLAEPELGRITRSGEISFGTIPILEGLSGAINLLLPLVPGYSPLAPFSFWVVRTTTAHVAKGSPSWLQEGHDGGSSPFPP